MNVQMLIGVLERLTVILTIVAFLHAFAGMQPVED
ncbi:hypothetical protein ES703_35586 [subsurface metagenome]